MDDHKILRELFYLLEKIDNLHETKEKVENSGVLEILTSLNIAKFSDYIRLSVPTDTILNFVEIEINKAKTEYNELKTQLINPKNDGQTTSN